ncbi:hypothetical protein O3M35_010540 [Rhynocoris fuscipes]|uniref:Transcription factor CBF/NF-Y/archaeal histone domain-containing protein n=1 Tax=Rhynocoris fuscipes TaxID=488301 RepID=A0AAW1D4Q7_9HEMI
MEEDAPIQDVTEVTDPEQSTEKSPEQSKILKRKLVDLPLSRVKQIIKMDPDVSLVSTEAVFLIAKSAELFIANLSKHAYVFTSGAHKKTLQKKDIDSAIESLNELFFLEGALQ